MTAPDDHARGDRAAPTSITDTFQPPAIRDMIPEDSPTRADDPADLPAIAGQAEADECVRTWLQGSWPVLVCATLLTVTSGVTFHLHATLPEWGTFQNDLVAHIGFIDGVLDGTTPTPHPGFHLLVGWGASITGLSRSVVAVVVLTASVVTTYLITVHALRRHTPAGPLLIAIVGLGLSVAAALYVPWYSTNMYKGPGTPNVWHNPTWVVMQPWALGSFLAFVTWRQRRGTRSLATLSVTLLISSLFKPSWAIVFVPVLALVALKHLRRHTWWHLPIATAPTAALLGKQYLLASSGRGGGFAIDPWAVWSRLTPSVPVSIALALAFPVVASLAGRRERSWEGFGPAAGVLVVGFLQRALLVEVDRPSAGNWSWGYFIALKVLFVVTAVVALRAENWRLPGAVLLLHVLAGVLYLWRLTSGAGFL